MYSNLTLMEWIWTGNFQGLKSITTPIRECISHNFYLKWENQLQGETRKTSFHYKYIFYQTSEACVAIAWNWWVFEFLGRQAENVFRTFCKQQWLHSDPFHHGLSARKTNEFQLFKYIVNKYKIQNNKFLNWKNSKNVICIFFRQDKHKILLTVAVAAITDIVEVSYDVSYMNEWVSSEWCFPLY